MIPTVPISMRLSEYSMCYGLRNVTSLPQIFYVILAQYSGHYFSGRHCKPDQNETACEGYVYLFRPMKVVTFQIYLV